MGVMHEQKLTQLVVPSVVTQSIRILYKIIYLTMTTQPTSSHEPPLSQHADDGIITKSSKRLLAFQVYRDLTLWCIRDNLFETLHSGVSNK